MKFMSFINILTNCVSEHILHNQTLKKTSSNLKSPATNLVYRLLWKGEEDVSIFISNNTEKGSAIMGMKS